MSVMVRHEMRSARDDTLLSVMYVPQDRPLEWVEIPRGKWYVASFCVPPFPKKPAPPSRWVKVEFYGLPPGIDRVTGIDPLEFAKALGDAFGFEYVAGLRVTASVEPDELSIRTGR